MFIVVIKHATTVEVACNCNQVFQVKIVNDMTLCTCRLIEDIPRKVVTIVTFYNFHYFTKSSIYVSLKVSSFRSIFISLIKYLFTIVYLCFILRSICAF